MAPIKFEEDIKDKLEQRVIKPSPDAWSRLSERLDAEPKKGNRPSFWWIGIAASFVGLMIVFSFIFSDASEQNDIAPVIVNEEQKDPIDQMDNVKDVVAEKEDAQEDRVAIEDPVEEIVTVQKQPIQAANRVVNKIKEDIVMSSEDTKQDDVDQAVPSKEAVVAGNAVDIADTELTKVDKVVAEIQRLQKERSAVSDATIDSLIARAQQELNSDRLFNETTKTVDAELLLMDVETELDQSFRDRVLEALRSGYSKVKTAVAERNN